MRATVLTLGCKVNEAESASIAATLEKMGFEVSASFEYADLYVLNTCAVTSEAEKKSRQLVARVRKFNDSAKIFVCGCASEKSGDAFTKKGVEFVCGAQKKELVAEAVARAFGLDCCTLLPPKQMKTRAFFKIQDGCDNFCSYCIIPYLRGRERSLKIEDIRGAIENCDSSEIVLNGINISSFCDDGRGLADLICALNGVNKRLRLGSLECGIIDDKLLSALKNLYDFAPQFHLSLQSGSTRILKAMNRRYTREEYIRKCEKIYSYFPDAAITTDIIAGFPTETDEDFKESLSIITAAGLARVHAFCYSPREGTVAAKMPQLDEKVKSERLHGLLAAADCARNEFIKKRVGKTYDFLAEEFDGGYTTGYTGNYIKIYLPEKVYVGQFHKVKIVDCFKDGALAALT